MDLLHPKFTPTDYNGESKNVCIYIYFLIKGIANTPEWIKPAKFQTGLSGGICAGNLFFIVVLRGGDLFLFYVSTAGKRQAWSQRDA